MKKALSTIILMLLMFLLLFVTGLLLVAIIESINGEESQIAIFDSIIKIPEENSSEKVNTNSQNISVDDNETNSSNISSTTKTTDKYYYYNQLNDTQKILYNGLEENKDNLVSGTYVIQYEETFSSILSQEDGKKILGEYYQAAIDAYIHDNPDLFYIDISKLYLNIETTKRTFKTTYKVFLSPKDGQTYYSDAFTSEQQVRTAIKKIESERNVILAKLKGEDYEDIKIIHDYLVDNISYDENDESISPYTIYGALVEKKCVCEGYARALKYLADSAGIDCVLIQGEATNSSGNVESHAWNAVLLDQRWYCIDATWDDPVIVGNGFVSSSIKYKYFLKGTDTFEKDHVASNEFSDGGMKFVYPEISKYDY